VLERLDMMERCYEKDVLMEGCFDGRMKGWKDGMIEGCYDGRMV
jgi:hypothetical protein